MTDTQTVRTKKSVSRQWRKGKKEGRIELRVDLALLRRFTDRCEAEGQNASAVLRAHMRDYAGD